MQVKPFDINSLRVASPCAVGWETMTGDERVRHCNSCQLNIYNTAAMTASEVEQLIGRREGRLCIRLCRRADGTVITRDCPVGLRDYRKRLARSIGATLSLIFGLACTGFAQKDITAESKPLLTELTKTNDQEKKTRLVGKVTDQNGAAVPGAEVYLYKEKRKDARTLKTDDKGEYLFPELSAGVYTLEVKLKWFKTAIQTNITVVNGFTTEVNVELEVAGYPEVVGIFAAEDLVIDVRSSTVETKIALRKISLIPHQ